MALSILNQTHDGDGNELKYVIEFVAIDGRIIKRAYTNSTKQITIGRKVGEPAKPFYNLKERSSILMKDAVSKRPTTIYSKSIISINDQYSIEI